MKRYLPLAICALFGALALQPGSALAQNGPITGVTLGPTGLPRGSVNVAVCSTFTTTAAAVSNNVATLTVIGNPLTSGFAVAATLTVYGFTGGDTYFNGSFSITALSSSTISYALTHANASAATNGTLYQTGNQTTSCAPLAALTTDNTAATSAPNPFTSDGLGNYLTWAAPAVYRVQLYGAGITTYAYLTGVNCIASANCTWSGTQTVTGTLAITGTLTSSGGSLTGSWAGTPTFAGGANINVGGALNGTFSGPTTLAGNVTATAGQNTISDYSDNGTIKMDCTATTPKYPCTSAGLSAAITAAGTSGTVVIPATAVITISSGSGPSIPRGIWLRCYPGALISLAQSANTLFTVGTGTDTTWNPGGIEGCRLSGNGGAADTSIGVQIGNGSNSAHGFQLVNDDITGFGSGLVFAGGGDGFAADIVRSRIHGNGCNGILFNDSPEMSHITDTPIFNNGQSNNNCAGIHVASGGLSPALDIKGGNIDGNSKNVGQIWVEAGSLINLTGGAGTHSENALQADVPFLQTDGVGASISQIQLSGMDIVQNPAGGTGVKPLIQVHSATVALSGNTFHQTVGASITPVIDAETDQQTRVVSTGNNFICGGTVANCQVFKMPNGSGSNRGTYTFAGSSLDPNYNSATNLTNIGTGSTTQSPLGCHDLISPNAFAGGPTGNMSCTGSLNSSASTVGKPNGVCVVDGVTNTTLSAAVTCAGTNGTIQISPGFAVPALTAGVTIPAGVTLRFDGGITPIPLGNFNLSINGPLQAPLIQLFSYTGTGTVSLGPGSAWPIYDVWFPGADHGAQVNNAFAAAWSTPPGTLVMDTPCVGAGCTAGGCWQVSTQVSWTKNITLTSGTHGATNNAGEHSGVCWTWIGGAGPMTLMSGTAASGSAMIGFRFDNTSTTLNSFHVTQNAAGKTLLQWIYIDPATVPALSSCIQIGDPVAGAVNDSHIENSRLVGCAPICLYDVYTQANLEIHNTWKSSCGYQGTVNTSNGALGSCAANCAQVATGANWPTDGSWTNVPVLVNNAIFIVSTVNSATSMTLTSAPGTQTGVNFARGAQEQFGSATSPSNIMSEFYGYNGPSVSGAVQCVHCLALPVVQYVNILGDHAHFGTTFETGSDSGVQGYAEEINSLASFVGSVECYACTFNATQGAAGGVASFVHLNKSAATYSMFGGTLGQNAGIMAATSYIFQNDSSLSILADGVQGFLSGVTLNYATGAKGTADVRSVGATNNGTALGDLFGGSAGGTSFGCLNTNNSVGDINICRSSFTTGGKIYWGTGTTSLDYAVTSAGKFNLVGAPLSTIGVFAGGGTACTNGELALSAGWGSTATVTAVVGVSQTCEWTITSSGTGQAANPTITDTLVNALPFATVACEMRMVGGTGTATLIDQTTLSSTAPVFTFGGTPVAASTYKVVRRCGP